MSLSVFRTTARNGIVTGNIIVRIIGSVYATTDKIYLSFHERPVQWRTEGGGFGVFKPPPRNSESPPKSCQTKPDCENC